MAQGVKYVISDANAAWLKRHYGKVSMAECIQKLGCSEPTVLSCVRALGLVQRRRIALAPGDLAYIYMAWSVGTSVERIQEGIGRGARVIRAIAWQIKARRPKAYRQFVGVKAGKSRKSNKAKAPKPVLAKPGYGDVVGNARVYLCADRPQHLERHALKPSGRNFASGSYLGVVI